eukprot:1631179-Alexandrium_andersonii.AAC.1
MRSELELPNIQNCFTRSELELRGLRSDLKIDPRSSRGVRDAPPLRADSESDGDRGVSGGSEG